jgi:hypothetical protein
MLQQYPKLKLLQFYASSPNIPNSTSTVLLSFIIIIIIIIIIITEIELSLGGSSPYTSTNKTNKNKHT